MERFMTMTRVVATTLVASLVLISCGGEQQITSSGNQDPTGKTAENPFQLGYGETATVSAENVAVTFTELIGESRCPLDVMCFWEGEVTIGLQIVDLPADTHFVPMTLSPGFLGPLPPSKDTLGFRITLLDVQPYPISSTAPTPDSEYMATIAIFRQEPMDTTLEGEIIIGTQLPAVGDNFQLDTVVIEGDIMRLTIWHSGGCGDHDFELFFSPAAFAESLPVQAVLRFRHTDLGDPCDAWLQREVTFDLRPLAQFYQIMYGTLDCMILHVSDDLSGTQISRLVTAWYYPSDMRPTSWCNQTGE